MTSRFFSEYFLCHFFAISLGLDYRPTKLTNIRSYKVQEPSHYRFRLHLYPVTIAVVHLMMMSLARWFLKVAWLRQGHRTLCWFCLILSEGVCYVEQRCSRR